MTTTKQIDAFLACKRIGFAGVSTKADDFSRSVFRELVKRGYDVVPIHRTATEIEGRRAYASVVDAPPLDAVYIMTPPETTEQIVLDCHRAGVKRVWTHRGAGKGSVDWHAWKTADDFGIDIVDGECIMMFLPNTQAVHRVHALLRRATGRYPDNEEHFAHRMRHAIGFGAIAWLLALWTTLTIGGIFGWDAGIASRWIVLPAAFGVLAYFHAGPGHLSPIVTAAAFALVGVTLDLAVTLFLPWPLAWFSLALGFVTALVAGTRLPARLAHA